MNKNNFLMLVITLTMCRISGSELTEWSLDDFDPTIEAWKKGFEESQEKVPESLPLALKKKRTFTGEKPHTCIHCRKKFRTRIKLKDHLWTHTDGKKPLGCSHPGCDKTYARSNLLKQHLVTHTEAQGFPCLNCENIFATTSNLTRHKKKCCQKN